ncbi:hypothetical protein BpHYR1_051170 [Brachionus plicatilis]|uniref:Uncharacterized protein n=1 Tax=Brachionus plicatilis TaxID=10195 RepID=A0A3M7RH87_BRAPC|nr:hypothetical protein BpHYR1_051170 [Brachionus plicatilis]
MSKLGLFLDCKNFTPISHYTNICIRTFNAIYLGCTINRWTIDFIGTVSIITIDVSIASIPNRDAFKVPALKLSLSIGTGKLSRIASYQTHGRTSPITVGQSQTHSERTSTLGPVARRHRT